MSKEFAIRDKIKSEGEKPMGFWWRLSGCSFVYVAVAMRAGLSYGAFV